MERARCVPGFSVIQPVIAVAKDPEEVAEAAVGLLRSRPSGARSFAVRARRRDKGFPLNSAQLAARVQRELGLSVDLSSPGCPTRTAANCWSRRGSPPGPFPGSSPGWRTGSTWNAPSQNCRTASR